MGNTYEYTGINESPTVALPVGMDLEQVNAKAVKLASQGVEIPAAGDIPVGIILTTEDEVYKKGSTVTVQVKDIGLWKAGAEIDLGDNLAVDGEGLCQKASAGQWIFARALSQATAKGDMIKVQIIHAGKETV